MLYLQLPARASVRLAGTLPASCSMRGVTDLDPILRLLTPARLQPLSLPPLPVVVVATGERLH